MQRLRNSSWLNALADLFFPPQCLGCHNPLPATIPPLFCPACQAQLPWIRPPLCTCCGTPFRAGGNHLCSACLTRPPSFILARSLFRYEEPIRSAFLGLKFKKDLAFAPSLAMLCSHSVLRTDFSEPDCIVPVPLHPLRLRERGFNQAVLLAHACFPQWRRRVAPLALVRQVYTPSQSSLDGRARRRNLRGAFKVADSARLVGKKVLLVDDVFTTGTTVEVCAKALKEAGVARVEVFTLARSVVDQQLGPFISSLQTR